MRPAVGCRGAGHPPLLNSLKSAVVHLPQIRRCSSPSNSPLLISLKSAVVYLPQTQHIKPGFRWYQELRFRTNKASDGQLLRVSVREASSSSDYGGREIGRATVDAGVVTKQIALLRKRQADPGTFFLALDFDRVRCCLAFACACSPAEVCLAGFQAQELCGGAFARRFLATTGHDRKTVLKTPIHTSSGVLFTQIQLSNQFWFSTISRSSSTPALASEAVCVATKARYLNRRGPLGDAQHTCNAAAVCSGGDIEAGSRTAHFARAAARW